MNKAMRYAWSELFEEARKGMDSPLNYYNRTTEVKGYRVHTGLAVAFPCPPKLSTHFKVSVGAVSYLYGGISCILIPKSEASRDLLDRIHDDFLKGVKEGWFPPKIGDTYYWKKGQLSLPKENCPRLRWDRGGHK